MKTEFMLIFFRELEDCGTLSMNTKHKDEY